MAFYSTCTRALTFENLHQDNALFNYNPSLVGAEDPPRPALDINSTATSSSTAIKAAASITGYPQQILRTKILLIDIVEITNN